MHPPAGVRYTRSMPPLIGRLRVPALALALATAACSLSYKGTPLFDGRTSEQRRAEADSMGRQTLLDYRRGHPQAWSRLVALAPICDEWDRERRYFMVCVRSLYLIENRGPQITTDLFALHWKDYLHRQGLPVTAQSDSLRELWRREAADLDWAMRTIMLPVLRDRYASCDEAHCVAMRAPTGAIALERPDSYRAWLAAAQAASTARR